MMPNLFFDVETTGIPDFKLPADHPSQPHIIQLAWIVDNGPDNIISEGNLLVRPDGWMMDDDLAAKLGHGLTHQHLLDNGHDIGFVLDTFFDDHDTCGLVIGYAVSFDLKMLRGECRRLGIDDRYGFMPKLDLMFKSRKPCDLGKVPKLVEAMKILCDEDWDQKHDAYDDICATRRLYYKLIELDVDLEPKQDVPRAKDE